jgi:hypothetical protein
MLFKLEIVYFQINEHIALFHVTKVMCGVLQEIKNKKSSKRSQRPKLSNNFPTMATNSQKCPLRRVKKVLELRKKHREAEIVQQNNHHQTRKIKIHNQQLKHPKH